MQIGKDLAVICDEGLKSPGIGRIQALEVLIHRLTHYDFMEAHGRPKPMLRDRSRQLSKRQASRREQELEGSVDEAQLIPQRLLMLSAEYRDATRRMDNGNIWTYIKYQL